MEKLSWEALEYEDKERSSDWFWALGIIVVTSAGASVIYGNYFFALLIVLSGALLGFYARRKPEIANYELNESGLKLRTRLYPYENIKAFWINIEHKPTLFIKSDRAFMPIISVPIEYNMADQVHAIFTEMKVLEEEMKEHPSEKIMEVLGF